MLLLKDNMKSGRISNLNVRIVEEKLCNNNPDLTGTAILHIYPYVQNVEMTIFHRWYFVVAQQGVARVTWVVVGL